jgi:hypothetical protein
VPSTPTPFPLLPTSELVAKFWLGSIPNLSPAMVSSQLPADASTWAATGFITVAVVGGTPDIDLPVKNPVLQLDFYAVQLGSQKAPWSVSNVLAETVRNATLKRVGQKRVLQIVVGNATYPPAVVQSAYFMTEPRRKFGDPGNYASYTADMAMTWVTVGDHITP